MNEIKKIKVVQIAYMGEDDTSEYLDDKGRVWYKTGHTERYDEAEGTYKTRYVDDGWKQLELPDEPTV